MSADPVIDRWQQELDRRFIATIHSVIGTPATTTVEQQGLTPACVFNAWARCQAHKEIPGKIRLVPAKNLVEQFRFPKSKKRRIRIKWMKREENWRPQRRLIFFSEINVFMIHPKTLEWIRKTPDFDQHFEVVEMPDVLPPI